METFTKDDIAKLLLCNTHIGTRTCENLMKTYAWKQRKDGIFIINISKETTLRSFPAAIRKTSLDGFCRGWSGNRLEGIRPPDGLSLQVL